MKTAVGAAPSPATALPAAATATPAMRKTLPSGRRRIVDSAITTTASVPSEFPRMAMIRAGQKSRCSCASGIAVPVTGALSGTASAIPTASPAYRKPTGAAQRRPERRSEPTPRSDAVSRPPQR